jgi:DNA-binding IclR family transcriptional regulator
LAFVIGLPELAIEAGGAVRGHDGNAIGVVTIAGPLFRLTEERMLALGPRLIAAAAAIAETSSASPLFKTHAA